MSGFSGFSERVMGLKNEGAYKVLAQAQALEVRSCGSRWNRFP